MRIETILMVLQLQDCFQNGRLKVPTLQNLCWKKFRMSFAKKEKSTISLLVQLYTVSPMQILGVLVSDLVHPNFHDFLIFYQ